MTILKRIEESLEIESKRTPGEWVYKLVGKTHVLCCPSIENRHAQGNGTGRTIANKTNVAPNTRQDLILSAHAANTFRPYLLALKRAIEQRNEWANFAGVHANNLTTHDKELSQLLEGTKEAEGGEE